MAALTLCINAGSSSVKYALFDDTLKCIRSYSTRHESAQNAEAHQAIEHALEQLTANGIARSDIQTCAHRFVFGGQIFTQATVIDDTARQRLNDISALAPLHMPPALHFVDAAKSALPHAMATGHFDTAFHQTIPKVNKSYALPSHYFDEGVCRFGFHGLSYAYISQQIKSLTAKPNGRWLIAHLGSGASLCGIKNGQSQMCTMGFSPLDGLPMASRSGQIDPGVIIHLLRKEGLSADKLETLLYKESGLLGLSGVTGDWGALKQNTNAAAQFAKDYFIEQIVQHIGKTAAHLEGLDGLVFTGGIGENDGECVAAITQRLRWLGICTVDLSKIALKNNDALNLTSPNAAIETWVIVTNEAAVMASEARQLNRTANASTDIQGSHND